jgi:hypothetical protein
VGIMDSDKPRRVYKNKNENASVKIHSDYDSYDNRKARQWAAMASEVTVIKPNQTREDVAEELKEKEERHKKKIEHFRLNSKKWVK